MFELPHRSEWWPRVGAQRVKNKGKKETKAYTSNQLKPSVSTALFNGPQAIVCEAVGLEDAVADAPRLVVARVPACTGDIRGGSTADQIREVRFLSSLSDPNVARILGVCAVEPVPWTIIEYTELGDLAHYLQYSVPLTGTLRPSCNLKALR